MNKLDLIEALRNKAQITKNESATVVNLYFDMIADAIAAGERVEIRGLCSFSLRNTPATLAGIQPNDRRCPLIIQPDLKGLFPRNDC